MLLRKPHSNGIDHDELSAVMEYLARSYPFGWKHAARCYREVGKLNQARRAMENYRVKESFDADDLEFLAELYKQLRDPRELNTVLDLIALYGRSHMDFGRASTWTQRLEAALSTNRLTVTTPAETERVLTEVVRFWEVNEHRADERGCMALPESPKEPQYNGRVEDVRRWEQRANHRRARALAR